MKTKTTLLGVIAAVLVAIGVTSAVLIGLDEQPKTQTQQKQQDQTPLPPANHQDGDIIRFTAEPNKTVLEQLSAHATVETKQSQFGTYVDAINGKKGGDDGKYWTFYVNGQMARVGADTYIAKGGETIEWKFE